MTETIQLVVNEHHLINRAMRRAFAGKASVLSELMQNARRAGASYVAFDYDDNESVLVVTDDGCGVEHMARLFEVAQSGWGEQVQAEEGPFGVGFLSALYYAKRVTVESNRQRIDFATDAALAFEPIVLEASIRSVGTRIALYGVEPCIARVDSCAMRGYLAEELARLAEGFPIDVRVDGHCLARPDAVGGERGFLRTEIGLASLHDWEATIGEKGQRQAVGCTRTRYYLQGLPVHADRGSYGPYNVVHLDPAQFFGRMPDRTQLVEQEHQVKRVRAVVAGCWRWRLSSLKACQAPGRFVQMYDTLRRWQCLDLLNDVPWVPSAVLGALVEYPTRRHGAEGWDDDRLLECTRPVSSEDIQTQRIVVFDLDAELNSDELGMPASMYCYLKHAEGALVLSGYLPKEHWLHNYVFDAEDQPVGVEVEGDRELSFQPENGWQVPLVLCTSYRLDGPLGPEVTYLDSVAAPVVRSHGDGSQSNQVALIIPCKETAGAVMTQVFSYYTEGDIWDEYEEDRAHQELADFILVNREDGAASVIERLIRERVTATGSVLGNRRFTVSFDESGDVKVEAA